MKDRIKARALFQTTEVCIECLLVTVFMGMMFYSLSTLL
jgi:hypothetical protein